MEKADKLLLYKDLCARLIYHPRIEVTRLNGEGIEIEKSDTLLYAHHLTSFSGNKLIIKPYLRPLDTMVESEIRELNVLVPDLDIWIDNEGCHIIDDFNLGYNQMSILLDWLNEHHFNYRLPKELFIYKPEYLFSEEEIEIQEDL